MTTIRKALILSLVVGVACTRGSPKAHRDSSAPDAASLATSDTVTRFVQGFYDWYVALANGPPGVSSYDSVMMSRRDLLAPQLYAALKEDMDAQRADTAGEIVSVTGEADAFLHSQDPCERYEAAKARATTSGYSVDIYARCPGAASMPGDSVSVIVDVERTGSSWRITNFRDSSNPPYDLLAELLQAKADRQKPANP